MLAGVNSEAFDDEESSNSLTSSDSDSLTFDGINNEFYTPNGGGPRDELKTPSADRVDNDETNEIFSASVTSDVSDGGRTIITQYHDEESGVPFLLYLSDGQSRGNGIENDVPSDGVFDLYSVHRNEDGQNVYNVYGTVEAGDEFNIDIEKQGADLSVNVNGVESDVELRDGEGGFFKFGSYIQAEFPDGDSNDDGELIERGSDEAADALRDIGITQSEVTFDDLEYAREEI